jgi:uncharacterized glyoxalase superfamily protein PhnB
VTFPDAGPGDVGPVSLGRAWAIFRGDAEPASWLSPRVAVLLYEDAAAAIDYLQRTFGFELRLTHIGAAGRPHNELLLGEDGLVMLGQAGESFSSPRTLDIFPASMIHIYVEDVESLHARARNAGAEVTDLELSPAGDRRFTATDPEGQVWVLAQRVSATDR